MSERAAAAQPFHGATCVPVWTRPSPREFAAADRSPAGGFFAWRDQPDATPGTAANGGDERGGPGDQAAADGTPATDATGAAGAAGAAGNPGAESLVQQGYALGLAEGRRLAEAQIEVQRALAQAEERATLAPLIRSLEALRPEPPADLAALLATSVRRLVAQIVGEVQIDAALLAQRTGAVAALIAEENAPARLRLNPADAARLDPAAVPLDIVADPAVAPGAVLLETASGWIEDGPAVRLEKLRHVLDRMGAPG